MRGTMSLLFLTAFLAACVPRRGPETPKVDDNAEATHRVDILPEGHGSAVVLTEDGYLLTCHHVAGEGDREMLINIAEGDHAPVAYKARVVAWDKARDLAVIKVDRRFERTVALGAMSDLNLLDEVYNIGFPYDFGELAGKGHIKSLDFDETTVDYVIEDSLLVEISDGPGTSGSGVFLTRSGKLIGLMRGILAKGPDDPRQVVTRVVIRIDVIREFLDDANIPYRTDFPLASAGAWTAASGTPAIEPVMITIRPPVRRIE